MFIALDIGNSSINIGFYTSSGFFVQRINTYPVMSPLKYRALMKELIEGKKINELPEGIIISSVVPSHTEVLIKAVRGIADVEPVIASWKLKTGLTFNIPAPEELGSDRIANAVAAYNLYKCPVAAVDFGTATTISVVGQKADYLGGAIIPGLRLMNESLAKGTYRLHEVHIIPSGPALGTGTIRCIQSGLLYGTAGAVERLLKEIEKETGFNFKVVVTGGYSALISKFMIRKHDLQPHLTLEGLKILHMRNADV